MLAETLPDLRTLGSMRTTNLLCGAGIATAKNLQLAAQADLRQICGIGKPTIMRIVAWMQAHDLRLRRPDEPLAQKVREVYNDDPRLLAVGFMAFIRVIDYRQWVALTDNGITTYGALGTVTTERLRELRFYDLLVFNDQSITKIRNEIEQYGIRPKR